MTKMQTLSGCSQELCEGHAEFGSAGFSAVSGSIIRNTLFLTGSLLWGSGCVQVENLQVTEPPPKPQPALPVLPEGPHLEIPIRTEYERIILVGNGERVSKGDLLVVYSKPALRSLEIPVERDSYSSDYAQETFDTLRRLVSEKAVSVDEVEKAALALKLSQLQQELNAIRLDAMQPVKAPFGGTVRIDSTSNSPSISIYPDGGTDVLRSLTNECIPPSEP